jgi:hypothetical protein
MKEASTAFHMHGGKNVTRGAATQIAGELFAFGDFPRILLKLQREAGSVVVNPYTPPHPTPLLFQPTGFWGVTFLAII